MNQWYGSIDASREKQTKTTTTKTMNNQTKKRSHNKESIEVDECAQSILTAIKTGKQKVYLPSKLKWIPLLNAVCPRFLQYKVSQAVDNQSQH